MVPEGWKPTKLGDISSLVTSGSRDWAKFYSDSGSKFIRMTNLRRDGIHLKLDDLKFVNIASDSADGKRTSLQADDILISITAELGKVGWVPPGLGEAYINQHTALVRVKPTESDSKFVAYLLSSKPYHCRINSLNDAGAKAGLNLTTIRSLPIALPDIPEQKKIAQILSTWDQAITATERLLENSQKRKKGLMQQLLTGKKRLPGFEGQWETKKLKSLCAINTGKKDVNEGNPDGAYPFFTCASEPTRSDNYSYDCEALLIAGNGIIGKTHYFKGKFEAYQRTYILNDFDNGIEVSYLHQFILYWLMRDIDREKQHGAMPYIKLGLLQNFRVFVPTMDEQRAISQVLSAADCEIAALLCRLRSLKHEKKALMQQLLTGKRRVNVETEAA